MGNRYWSGAGNTSCPGHGAIHTVLLSRIRCHTGCRGRWGKRFALVVHFLHKGKIERFKAIEKDRGVGFEFDTYTVFKSEEDEFLL